MRSGVRRWSQAGLVAATLAGCGFGSSTLDEADPEAAPMTPTYGEHIETIMDLRCNACHSVQAQPGELNGYGFDTCAKVKRFWGPLWNTAAVSKTMPPGGADRVTSAELLTLQRWHDQGGRCD
ncbi:MAG: hypothetical protein R3F60_00370 [bacterium]